MKIQYLGTAAAEGWPGLFCKCPACTEAAKRGGKNLRTRSQAVIDGKILMDLCPDTYMHMLLYKVNLPDIKHCLITHTHDDHFYIEETKMRCPWFANDVDEVPFTLYGNDELVRRMEEYKGTSPVHKIWSQGIAVQELKEFETVELDGYKVFPTLAHHNPQEKCFNYVIQKDGKTMLYGHDSGPFLEETWAQLKQFRFDFVTLDCTMLISTHSGTHMNIGDCVATRERMCKEGMADENTVFCINHFSHNGCMDEQGKLWLHEELVPYMQEKGFLVSYDGMEVSF